MTFTFFPHWAVSRSHGITTFKKPGLFAVLLHHSSISFTKIHRHKTCSNCLAKRWLLDWYIANVKQSPLSWWYHIHQILAVYWRIKLPWKSAYEIIPVNWKSLTHSTYTFFLLASSKQISDDLQDSQRSENCCKFVLTKVSQTDQMSRTA